jgi:hypothetical protein
MREHATDDGDDRVEGTGDETAATGGRLPDDLKELESRLAALVPSPGRLDRDALLFAAGRRAAADRAESDARPQRAAQAEDVVARRVLRIWQAVATVSLLVAGVCGIGWRAARSGTATDSSMPAVARSSSTAATPETHGPESAALPVEPQRTANAGPTGSHAPIASHSDRPPVSTDSGAEMLVSLSFGHWRRAWSRAADGLVPAELESGPLSDGATDGRGPGPPQVRPATGSYLKLRAEAIDL